MTIRSITAADIPACVPVYVNAYKQAPWNYHWTEAEATKYLSEHFDTPHFAGFVLLEGDQIKAVILGRKKTWWTGNQFFIDELFVASDTQRKGYGKQLLQHAATYAKQNGMNVLALMTNKYMPAYEFYLKNDFLSADQFTFLFKMIM